MFVPMFITCSARPLSLHFALWFRFRFRNYNNHPIDRCDSKSMALLYIIPSSHSVRRMNFVLTEMHNFKYWLCLTMAPHLLLMAKAATTFVECVPNEYSNWQSENMYREWSNGFFYLLNLITLIAYTLKYRKAGAGAGVLCIEDGKIECGAKCFSSFRLAIKFC